MYKYVDMHLWFVVREFMHINSHMHSVLQSIEKEETEGRKKQKLLTHIHTTASTA